MPYAVRRRVAPRRRMSYRRRNPYARRTYRRYRVATYRRR